MQRERSAVVLGGSGFVGRYVVTALAKEGFHVRVVVRHPHEALFLKTQGEVGQITLIPGSILDKKALLRACEGAEALINLVGILFEKGPQRFKALHHEALQIIAEVALEKGVLTLIHLSALGASLESASQYAQTKAKGEIELYRLFPQAIIFRPSVIFGAEDQFLNRFSKMAHLFPILPLIGGGKTRLQPVYVQDVAKAIVKSLNIPEAKGKIFELGGPRVYTFKEIIQLILHTTHQRCLLFSIPFIFARWLGFVLQFCPNPPLTKDQVLLLQIDNVVKEKALGFKDLGLSPASLKDHITFLLKRF